MAKLQKPLDPKIKSPFMNYLNPMENLLDPTGRYLIYGGAQRDDPVFLTDLKTDKIQEFLPSAYSVKSIGAHIERLLLNTGRSPFNKYLRRRFYGFSDSGAYAYALLEGGRFKLWSLPEMEEQVFSVEETDGEIIKIKFDETNIRLLTLEISRKTIRQIDALTMDWNNRDPENRGHLPTKIIKNSRNQDLILRKRDLKTGESRVLRISDGLRKLHCGFVTEDLSTMLFVEEDGSLFKSSLIADPSLPLKNENSRLFGPVKGFQFSENPSEIKRQCRFLSGGTTNILLDPKTGGHLLRVINEGKEFFIPHEWLYPTLEEEPFHSSHLDPQSISVRIQYPFVFHYDHIGGWHIPTGRYHPTKMNFLPYQLFHTKTGTPVFHIVSTIPDTTQGHTTLQITRHPFAPSPQDLIFEIEEALICESKILENGVFLINTIWGDLFAVDLKTGFVRRYFIGGCLKLLAGFSSFFQKALNAPAFLSRRQEKNLRLETVVYKFAQHCWTPLTEPPKNTETVLLQLAEKEDPTTAENLALFTSVIGGEEVIRDHPETLRQILWKILSRAPFLYVDLHRQFPILGKIPPPDSLPNESFHFMKNLRVNVKKTLELTVSENYFSRLSDWRFLYSIQPFLRELPEEEQNRYMENITLSVLKGARRTHPDLMEGVFQSKLYYVINGHIQELFGRERRLTSDITVTRTPYSSDNLSKNKEEDRMAPKVIILSSDPIEDWKSVSTDFGIHYAVVKRLNADPMETKKESVLFDDRVEWSIAGGKGRFRAKIRVTPRIRHGQSVSDLIPNLTGPDYEAVWRDGRMIGMVIIGSSLRDYSQWLADQYLFYLEQEGFQFSSGETTDTKRFFREWVKNCKIDWFARHGHSGGNERDILRFDRRNHIIRAVREGEKGIEEFYLLAPHPGFRGEEETTVSLSNREFARAVAVRDANECGQLTYFNTSCWSAEKARYEIGEVNSPSFLNIPATTITEVFENSPEDAVRSLIHSYRQGLDFDGFRQALQPANPRYNGFIFPDEPAYQEKVLDYLRFPLNISIELEEQTENGWQSKPEPFLN